MDILIGNVSCVIHTLNLEKKQTKDKQIILVLYTCTYNLKIYCKESINFDISQ